MRAQFEFQRRRAVHRGIVRNLLFIFVGFMIIICVGWWMLASLYAAAT
jgi:hypothetical protein